MTTEYYQLLAFALVIGCICALIFMWWHAGFPDGDDWDNESRPSLESDDE